MNLAQDFTILVVAAFCGGLLARRWGQPLVLGYIAAGVVLSPHMGLVELYSTEELEVLSEIGVALLLFVLALEFSLKDLAPVRWIALIGTPLQIALMILFGLGLASALGWGWKEGLWLGAMLSLSSTMVILKTLDNQGWLGTLSSRVMIGILIVQDLAVIPLMVLLPQFDDAGLSFLKLLPALFKAAGFLVAMLLVGTRLLPWVLRLVVRLQSPELFLVACTALALGIGLLTHELGLSYSLGAFVAGLVLSESDYGHRAGRALTPLRDVFGLLFFASVGSLFDPWIVLAYPKELALLVLVASLAKGLLFAGLSWSFGYRNVIPLALGLGMFQIGEFSLVLGRVGLSQGSISGELYGLVLTSAVLTMALTPPLSALTAPLYGWFRRRNPGLLPLETINLPPVELEGHVVIAGGGHVGSYVAQTLERLGLKFVLIELDRRQVEALQARGWATVYGDAAHDAVLHAASLERACLLLVTVPNQPAALGVVARSRALAPELDTVVRAEEPDQIDELLLAGAHEVVVPKLEASLELLRQALGHLGTETSRVYSELEFLRDEVAGGRSG